MCRKAFLFGGLLLLTAAVILATPNLSLAQHGGGHGGGGHYGGGHYGGGHYGGYVGGAHYGGYRGGWYGGGVPYYGGYRHGFPYAHHGYRPFYGFYDYPYSYSTNPYVWSGPVYDPGYSSSYGDVVPYSVDGTTAVAPSIVPYQAFYPPATVTDQPDNSAHVTVKVPADAQVWFDGSPTTSTGPVRQFDSPPLTPGNRYTYEIRARWNENGKEVTQIQKAQVTGGARVEVDFPVQTRTAEKTPTSQEP